MTDPEVATELVKYNHPKSGKKVWFIGIKGCEPKWAVNIRPYVNIEGE